MTWADLFGRAAAFDTDLSTVRERARARRTGENGTGEPDGPGTGDGPPTAGESSTVDESTAANGPPTADESATTDETKRPPPVEPTPARVVADADALAADLLVGDDAREALDQVREHSWMALVASDRLLADAAAVVSDLADQTLASDWRSRVEAWRTPVEHPAGDHPALASAYRGGAMHVLTYDERLLGAGAGARIRGRVETSVRRPDAFAALFDAASLYREVEGGEYPGPDRDPRE